MICSDCKNECYGKEFNDGFYYSYGSENGWHDESYEGSDCCGAEILEGKWFLEKSRFHIARGDDPKNGIKKGDKYSSYIRKGYCIQDGVRKGLIVYKKKLA